jgi:uncharacterized protein (DUF1501 family)
MNRRQLIKALGAATLGSGISAYCGGPALAQTSGYRALVCVFLYGGNDGLNTITPIDNAGYARYAAVRKNVALAQTDLIALNAAHGLHPALAPLKSIWDSGKLAPVFNVGPLARPLTQADYLSWRETNDISRVPDNLFSHSDQQILWENCSPDKLLRTGWGARLLDALGANQSVVSISGNTRFGEGNLNKALVLPTPGSELGLSGMSGNRYDSARRVALDALVGASRPNALHVGYAAAQRDAFSIANSLGAILKQAPVNGAADAANPELSTAFGNLSGVNGNPLSKQLYQVAKLLKNRAVLGGSRHIFFVSLGGFDTHANQMAQHATLLTQMGVALAGFYRATQDLGIDNQVTLFTQSDFGRTFKPNGGGGTDHAWGNQHLVMGGAVLGGLSYGTYPSLILGGSDDAGRESWEQQGRWIPSTSVDQYAATLASWLAPEQGANLINIFPSLRQFTNRNLGFLPNV